MFSKVLGLVFLVASVTAQIQEGHYHIFNAQHPTWSLQTLEGKQECYIASTNEIPPPRAEWEVKRAPRSPPGLYTLRNIITDTLATFDATSDPVGQAITTNQYGTAFRINTTDNQNFVISVVGQEAVWSFGRPFRGRAKVELAAPAGTTMQNWNFELLE